MNKAKLLANHYSFFRGCVNILNHIRLKNRLCAKGCKVSMGISVINGLKIINHGCGNEVTVGDFVRIKNSTIVIRGNHNKITIKDRAYLNQVEFCMEDSGNEISIGERTSLCGKTHLATIEGTKIVIGDRCLFSSDLHFTTGDSHSIVDLQGERINPSKDIVIEDHVWIGTKVTCLKGVYISEDSIVAATTTLNKEYKTKNVIIGGVPGKVIKTDVNWAAERI